jgi:structure-specific endonuclease subunit SLX1
MYLCYCLVQKNVLEGFKGFGHGPSTYIGCTNNFTRRIRQHNCDIKGGAKITSRASKLGAVWIPILFAEGFIDNHQALSFEWHWKRISKKQKGSAIEKRIAGAQELLKRAKFEHIVLRHESTSSPMQISHAS